MQANANERRSQKSSAISNRECLGQKQQRNYLRNVFKNQGHVNVIDKLFIILMDVLRAKEFENKFKSPCGYVTRNCQNHVHISRFLVTAEQYLFHKGGDEALIHDDNEL